MIFQDAKLPSFLLTSLITEEIVLNRTNKARDHRHTLLCHQMAEEDQTALSICYLLQLLIRQAILDKFVMCSSLSI